MRAFVIAMENEAVVVRPFLKDGDRLYVAGVGKVNAAAATQKAIDAGADEILNCGVAGGLDPAMEVGEPYEISQAVEYDFDLTIINGTKLGTHNERTTPYFDCRTGGKFPARILATGAAIAHVCELNGVPCRMLKCLSDVHGKGAMTGQYKDNLAKALSHLKEALASWIGLE